MRKISYTVHFGNGKPEKHTKTLFEFFLEQGSFFLFFSGVLPPFDVLKDLFTRQNEKKTRGFFSQIKWQPFELLREEYDELAPLLIDKLSLSIAEVPEFIITVYEWNLWGTTYKFGVPYEKYKQLSDDVLDKRNKLDEALKTGNQDEITYWHLQHFYAGTAESEFLDEYFPSNE